ncbi:glycoside hydrolase family 2 TIM barrel-domain containing protein [Tamlana sp. 2_MG-2023]|uniref:glycoside hydrolase family 2 TIM barrel-domain containing protein n=1 Tax=unclassified Tamlana TaxID=2614803 RepID=UPI0026E38923|nr:MULTISPECIES: glycoside hydrolase family 2 TIM barrel-domain containing protein [unclassified Tamlana]MDO6761332.1 glycoside hydrolase family 2 TIM barrel-domain containing protein [Tamlana sp. 2_MG-2023]MDO6791815.1 glycoside hydrolase family 2 TIM barrel-domain containing protein [Tamlana sp. 1_MG-2023]
MKNIFCVVFILSAQILCYSQNIEKIERELDFNLDWNFYLSDKDVDEKDIKTSSYKKVNLPHDWVVEHGFDESLGDDAKATGFLPSAGYGYYKKTFELIPLTSNKTYILFDGVYNNSETYINGHKLGFHPYGYSPFYYDITPYLNTESGTNEIFVKVDHSRFADSRWYTGAGIYRNVSLITTNKLHIPIWGTFVTTPEITDAQATVNCVVKIENDFVDVKTADLKTQIFNESGKLVAESLSSLKVNGGLSKEISENLKVSNPKLWSVDTPYLYTVVHSVIQENKIIDQTSSKLGIRSFKFDAKTGFYLNGKNMKIKGVCLHHDGGLVGSAVPKGVWERRLKILKEGGVNAVRISHNPGSVEFLDLCDEMGFLVQDEFFDEWDNPKDKRLNTNEKSVDYVTRGYQEHFQEWAQKDLTNVMLSHRNHASIFQWSIGNEIEWTYPRNADATGFFGNMNWDGNYFWSAPPYSIDKIKEQLKTLPKGKYDIGETAAKLSKWTKALDTTRPVTANMILPSVSHLSGYADALDVVGYSYRRVLYDYGHENYPDKPIMGTENLAQYHEWKSIMERPFISGTFLWTGVDYMGEIRAPWPMRVQPSGLLTTAGFKKGSYYMMQSLWTEKPMLHIATQNIEKSLNKINDNGEIVAKNPKKWEQALWEWQDVNEHWNYKENEMIAVEIYSNCDEIELFLNNKPLGKKYIKDFQDHIYKWGVPFASGTLVAKGVKGGVQTESKLITATQSSEIQLIADNLTLDADHYDVSNIVVQLKDKKGNPVVTDDREITFEVTGPAKLLGVDNGWKKSVQPFQSNVNTTHNGKTLVILQATGDRGTIKLKAKGKGLKTELISIKSN